MPRRCAAFEFVQARAALVVRRRSSMPELPSLPDISTELAAARAHAQQGRLDAAEQAYRRVLDENPTLPEALRFLAHAALAHGRPGDAAELLSKALIGKDRNDPDLLLELGAAYRAGGRPDAARYVLERAVALGGPQRPAARLMLANAMEFDQRPDLALLHYFRAILDAQGAGQWLGDDTTEPGLRQMVRHAMAFTSRERRQLFDGALRDAQTGASEEPSNRIRLAVSLYLRDIRQQPDDPRQKPTFLYVPSLGMDAFLDHASLPWLEDCTRSIARLSEEVNACAYLPSASSTSLFSLGNLLGQGSTKGEAPGKSRVIPIYQRGNLANEAKVHAPRLVAALDETPLVHIPRHGPDASIILLESGKTEPLRYGRSNSRVVVTIALADSALMEVAVGGEKAILQPGHALVFDPSFGYEYAASPASSGPARAVSFEVWHPGLSEPERRAIEILTTTAVQFDARLAEIE